MVSISSLIAIFSYGIVLCGIIPLFPWLEIFPRTLLVTGMAAGMWQDRTRAWPLKNWMFNAVSVPVFLYYAVQFSRSNPVQPVVTILAAMLALRLAGPKSSRHYLQIAVLSLFSLSSSSLFDLSPVFLVYLALMLFLVAIQLVLLTFYSQDSNMRLLPTDLRKVLLSGLLIPLTSLPLLVLFFPLLPRTQLPLWNFIAAPASRPSGFSERVEPGSSQSVTGSKTLAFRAEMRRQPQQNLYWRGTVFNRVEGNSWIRVGVPAEDVKYAGQRTVQIIYPEPGSSRMLVALDAPVVVSQPRTRRMPDGTHEWQGASRRRLNYRADSATTGVLPVPGGINKQFYLRLPDSLSPRIREMANDIRKKARNDSVKLERIEMFFRNGGFRYSQIGLATGEHALEQFLFETKQGHCEFFASAYALLLRAAGIPSRVVGGYLGGEYNDLGGYYLVSEEMAHVWVEAYEVGKGWVRIDPSSFAVNADAVWGGARQRSALLRFRMLMDSLDHTWNRTVITYDFERQMEAAVHVGGRIHDFRIRRYIVAAKPYLLVSVTVVLLGMLFRYRRRLFLSREERILNRFYRRVERDLGLDVHRGRQGLFEIASSCDNQGVHDFAAIYAAAVYHDRKLTDSEFERLKMIVRSGFRPRTS